MRSTQVLNFLPVHSRDPSRPLTDQSRGSQMNQLTKLAPRLMHTIHVVEMCCVLADD